MKLLSASEIHYAFRGLALSLLAKNAAGSHRLRCPAGVFVYFLCYYYANNALKSKCPTTFVIVDWPAEKATQFGIATNYTKNNLNKKRRCTTGTSFLSYLHCRYWFVFHCVVYIVKQVIVGSHNL